MVWDRRRQIAMLFFVFVFFCAASPVVAITRWVCEGRVCSISFGLSASCCCADTNTRIRDKDCGDGGNSRKAPASQSDTLACTDGCGCEGKTIHAGGKLTAGTVKASPVAEPVWAILPPAVAVYTPLFIRVVPASTHAGRGPPVFSTVPLTLSLRAPPSAA